MADDTTKPDTSEYERGFAAGFAAAWKARDPLAGVRLDAPAIGIGMGGAQIVHHPKSGSCLCVRCSAARGAAMRAQIQAALSHIPACRECAQ